MSQRLRKKFRISWLGKLERNPYHGGDWKRKCKNELFARKPGLVSCNICYPCSWKETYKWKETLHLCVLRFLVTIFMKQDHLFLWWVPMVMCVIKVEEMSFWKSAKIIDEANLWLCSLKFMMELYYLEILSFVFIFFYFDVKYSSSFLWKMIAGEREHFSFWMFTFLY